MKLKPNMQQVIFLFEKIPTMKNYLDNYLQDLHYIHNVVLANNFQLRQELFTLSHATLYLRCTPLFAFSYSVTTATLVHYYCGNATETHATNKQTDKASDQQKELKI